MWSTANVNLILDGCQDLASPVPSCVQGCKSYIIPTDMAPVQHPRHSWKSHVELPDHSWDQSRINAVTPMTFMSLKTKTIPCQSPASSVQNLDMHISDTTILHLTPSGQCVTLINLSFYESDTTFKCLNEVCYLLTLSEPDYMHAILLHCCKRKGTGLLALYLGSRQRLPVRLRTSQIIT